MFKTPAVYPNPELVISISLIDPTKIALAVGKTKVELWNFFPSSRVKESGSRFEDLVE